LKEAIAYLILIRVQFLLNTKQQIHKTNTCHLYV